jgi:nicotinamidase-related amidase
VKSFQGVDIAATLADLLNPAHLALVVYDMQVGICSQIADGDRVVSAVEKVLAVTRAAGVRTIFTRHMSLPVQLMGSMAFRTAMAWQRTDDPEKVSPWFLRDTPGFAIVPELQPLPSEAVFDKITMSAFEGTPLAITLRDCGVKAIAFVGIALEVGIEPSVRHAADLGFTPVIVSDACGYGDKVAADRSLEALTFSGDTVIVDLATFSAELRR